MAFSTPCFILACVSSIPAVALAATSLNSVTVVSAALAASDSAVDVTSMIFDLLNDMSLSSLNVHGNRSMAGILSPTRTEHRSFLVRTGAASAAPQQHKTDIENPGKRIKNFFVQCTNNLGNRNRRSADRSVG